MTQSQIAKKYGVGQQHISRIVSEKRWAPIRAEK
jgi:DNA-directed RNA polymerase specialized sigma subunit